MIQKLVLCFSVLVVTLGAASEGFGQWVQTNGPYGGEVTSFATLGLDLFAGTSGGGVFKSADSGSTWAAVNGGLRSNLSREIVTLGALGTNLVAGTMDGLFWSDDSGQNWNPADSGGNEYILSFASYGSALYAGAGNGGGIYYSADSGKSWEPIFYTSDSGRTWAKTTGNGYGAGFVLVDSIMLMGSLQYPGEGDLLMWGDPDHFRVVDTEFVRSAVDKLALIDSQLLLGNSPSGLCRSSNSGRTWILSDSGLPPKEQLLCVTVFRDRIIGATQWDGFFASEDSGYTWQPLKTGIPPSIWGSGAVLTTFGNVLLFGGDHLYRSIDSGQSWALSENGLAATHVQSFLSEDSILFAGTFTDLYKTTDLGTTWLRCTPPLIPEYTQPGIPAIGSIGNHIFVPGSAGIFQSSDFGLSWVLDSSVTGIQELAPLGDIEGFATIGRNEIAAGFYGLFRTTDSGQTWDTTDEWGEMSMHSVVSADSTLYALTWIDAWPDAQIYRSTDSGATWSIAGWPLPYTGQPPSDLVISLCTIGSSLFAGTYEHGVYCSTDGGRTWSNRSSGLIDTDIFVLVSDGSNLFAGGYGYGVFLSTDSGVTWHSVNENLPYLDIRSLAIHGGYLYAGTDGNGVCWRRPLSEMIAPSSVNEVTAMKQESRSNPNPFSQATTITFTSEVLGYADVRVVNLLGAEVARIFSGELTAGPHSFTWDASGVGPGSYWCVARMGGRTERIALSVQR